MKKLQQNTESHSAPTSTVHSFIPYYNLEYCGLFEVDRNEGKGSACQRDWSM